MTDAEITTAATPTVHMNGNRGSELLEEWLDFANAIRDAVEKFPYQSFNARNHYTTGSIDASQDAATEIKARLAALIHVAMEVAGKIDEQNTRRK